MDEDDEGENARTKRAVVSPPDGGYGWVVVGAAFYINFVVDGVVTSFAEFKESYMREFQLSASSVVLLGSLMCATCQLSAPFVGGMINRFHSRPVMFFGVCVAGLALAFASLSEHAIMFGLIYSFMGGIGYGSLGLPAIVGVISNFELRRALATGLAVAGSGVGCIVVPPVCRYLISKYRWQIALHFLAFLNFTMLAVVPIFRPVRTVVEVTNVDESAKTTAIGSPSVDQGRKTSNRLASTPPAAGESAHVAVEDTTSMKSRAARIAMLRSTLSTDRRSRKFTMNSMMSDALSRQTLARPTSRISARSISQLSSRAGGLSANTSSRLSVALQSSVDAAEFVRPFGRLDALFDGSVSTLTEFRDEGNSLAEYRESQLTVPAVVLAQHAENIFGPQPTSPTVRSHRFATSNMGSRIWESRSMTANQAGLAADEIADQEDLDAILAETKRGTITRWIPASAYAVMSEMIDLSLLQDPKMVFIIIANVLAMLGYYVPFVFVQDLSRSIDGSSARTAYLLSAIGVSNTFARVFFGWFADRKLCSPLTIQATSLLVCGMLTVTAPLLPSVEGLMLYCILFGFFVAGYVSLTSIVLVELVGLSRLTNAYGLLTVARGVATLSGTPTAGLLFDKSGSYAVTFHVMGSLIIMAAIMIFVIANAYHLGDGATKASVEEKDPIVTVVSGDFAEGGGLVDEPLERLSVLSEHSEEHTDYQRTVQSLKEQQALIAKMSKHDDVNGSTKPKGDEYALVDQQVRG